MRILGQRTLGESSRVKRKRRGTQEEGIHVARKTCVVSNRIPKPVGPYSHATCFDNLLFCAGQIGIGFETGELVAGGVSAETKQALENLRAIIENAGSGLDKVLKTTVFLRDLRDFQQMNEVYRSFFPTDPPARSCVQVSGLPKGATVEIEAIAYVPPKSQDRSQES